MSFPLAQLFCGKPPQIISSHAASINQHLVDGTFLLPSLQPTNQSKPNAAAHQPNPEPSALLSSPLKHQAICMQSIHKTIQQFNQYLKAKHLDRQALQLIALQLHNDFALLRYLLFSDTDTAAPDPATSPLNNPNPIPNTHPASSALTLPCTDDAKHRRSSPVGAMGSPGAKTNNSSNADFQPLLNKQDVPSTTVQNLAARIGKLEKLFTDEVATYTSITAGSNLNTFSCMIKFANSNPAIQMLSFGKFPQ